MQIHVVIVYGAGFISTLLFYINFRMFPYTSVYVCCQNFNPEADWACAKTRTQYTTADGLTELHFSQTQQRHNRQHTEQTRTHKIRRSRWRSNSTTSYLEMAVAWQPDPAGLQQIVQLLKESQYSDTQTQRTVHQVQETQKTSSLLIILIHLFLMLWIIREYSFLCSVLQPLTNTQISTVT